MQVFDVGREGQALYVVMEYLDGAPLSHRIRNERLGVPDALRIVAVVCDALSYAHERGVIHRDIKPANIFLTTENVVKVLDFGLALQADDRPGFAGTPPYMSPEQISGGNVDTRSDVWSVGVTLFEILTGGCPFVADDLYALRMKIADSSLPELPPQLPFVRALKSVLSKALAKERAARYQTAAEFAVDLRSLILEIQRADINSPLAASLSRAHDQDSSRVPTDSLEQTIPAPKSLVNLGFDGNTRARVFLIRPKQRKWFDAYNISTSHALGGLVAGVALMLLSTGLAGLSLFWQLSLSLLFRAIFLAILAAFFALVVLGALVRIIFESIFPPQVLRCRSCQRKMRTASDWRRSIWSVDTQGLCVADCVTALQEDHWEDAVTLFLLHTTSENAAARYRLMFLQCRFCRDQRAYFWFSPRSHEWSAGSEADWFEAYKFFDPRKAEEFARNETSLAGPIPPISSKNAGDGHGQKTI